MLQAHRPLCEWQVLVPPVRMLRRVGWRSAAASPFFTHVDGPHSDSASSRRASPSVPADAPDGAVLSYDKASNSPAQGDGRSEEAWWEAMPFVSSAPERMAFDRCRRGENEATNLLLVDAPWCGPNQGAGPCRLFPLRGDAPPGELRERCRGVFSRSRGCPASSYAPAHDRAHVHGRVDDAEPRQRSRFLFPLRRDAPRTQPHVTKREDVALRPSHVLREVAPILRARVDGPR